MDSVKGLHAALSLYASDSARDRARALTLLPPLLANPANLAAFHAAAAAATPAWLALFHCLFRAVALEKAAVRRPHSRNAAAERLAHAVRLVRLVAEQAVHRIARKPLMALLAHMRHHLVASGRIFQPALLDYAKAIHTLLAYPPHRESIDRHTWLALICTSTIC
ncbi:serine/threonine-protein kinase TEL1 [Cryptococcus gattii EJB2]|uniref:Serine/threonine-protein kinase TEL1 n=1 Tax=Cryptococcus gattii EJB2 TaxID=1296103 RepID=A0ABR5C426_9TREE|nr:serine/threonine-protein kinase TEL1 [Cryptococcus gattii EJB2]